MNTDSHGQKSPSTISVGKSIFLLLAFIPFLFGKNSIAQDNAIQSAKLLTQYYSIKNALVNDNANTAATKAAEFVKTVHSMEIQTLPAESQSALLKDVSNISKTTDIKKQREYFAGFSDHMFAFIKETKLGAGPIHKAYCPMKKASWLSEDVAIKNPYYGSAMLTCGKVVETLK